MSGIKKSDILNVKSGPRASLELIQIFNDSGLNEIPFRDLVKRLLPSHLKELAWLGYYCSLTPDEETYLKNLIKVDNLKHCICSYNCKNSTCIESNDVFNSEDVCVSQNVHDSIDIFDCTDIHAVTHCTNSDTVINSVQVFSSKVVYNSQNIGFSSNISFCTNVGASGNLSQSAYILGSKNLSECRFCSFCNNLESCFFCVGLNDKDHYICNQPATTEEINNIINQWVLLPSWKTSGFKVEYKGGPCYLPYENINDAIKRFFQRNCKDKNLLKFFIGDDSDK